MPDSKAAHMQCLVHATHLVGSHVGGHLCDGTLGAEHTACTTTPHEHLQCQEIHVQECYHARHNPPWDLQHISDDRSHGTKGCECTNERR